MDWTKLVKILEGHPYYITFATVLVLAITALPFVLPADGNVLTKIVKIIEGSYPSLLFASLCFFSVTVFTWVVRISGHGKRGKESPGQNVERAEQEAER